MDEMTGWIGVDLDGTLAMYTEWRGEHHIGPPVPAMVNRVKAWLAEGVRVKIFTARAAGGQKVIKAIQDWCEEHVGARLEVTCIKDYGMIELWDDRAVQVVCNTGARVDESVQRLMRLPRILLMESTDEV